MIKDLSNYHKFTVHIPDSFDLGHDIQTYYSLYQGLTLEDLAKTNRSHTVKGIMKVVSKVRVIVMHMHRAGLKSGPRVARIFCFHCPILEGSRNEGNLKRHGFLKYEV